MSFMVNIPEIQKQSVTAADGKHSIHGLLWGGHPGFGTLITQHLDKSRWRTRDLQLLATTTCPNWSKVIVRATQESASIPYTVNLAQPRKRRKLEELLLFANLGDGYSSMVQALRFYHLVYGNGWFVEIVRRARGAGSEIVGLIALDPLRCYRTGNPQTPVIYTDSEHVQHELQRHQVMFDNSLGVAHDNVSTLPDGYSEMNPAAIIYPYVFLHLAYIQRFSDKATGQNPQEIEFVNGISSQMLDDAVTNATFKQQAKASTSPVPAPHMSPKAVRVGEKLIVPVMDMGATVNGYKVAMAGLPADLTYEQFLKIIDLNYAINANLDPQVVNPQNVATRSLSSNGDILAEQSEKTGDGTFSVGLQQQINMWVAPELGAFSIAGIDLQGEKQRAEVDNVHIKNATEMLNADILNTTQSAEYLAERHVIVETVPALMAIDEVEDSEEPKTETEEKHFRDLSIRQDLILFLDSFQGAEGVTKEQAYQYLWYVDRHIHYVKMAAKDWNLAPADQVAYHDLSKYSMIEFLPYARKHMGDGGDVAYKRALSHHIHNNPHHWLHWTIGGSPIDMPFNYVGEMVADWMGVSMAINGSWDIKEWLTGAAPEITITENTEGLLVVALASIGLDSEYLSEVEFNVVQ